MSRHSLTFLLLQRTTSAARSTLAALLALAALFVAARARAEPPRDRAALERVAADPASAPDDAASALYALGEMDEDAASYARALGEYEASFARSPSSRFAPRAQTHADYLRARAEGDFAPLARLDSVRHDPAKANDAAEIDRLAKDLEAFPPGLVRVEARTFVAEAYLGRLHRKGDGIAELRRALAEPKIDPLTARAIARRLVDEILATGDVDAAVAEAHAQRARLDPKFVTSVERRVLRRALDRVALGDFAVLALFAGAALALARRRGRLEAVVTALRRSSAIALLFAAYVAIAGGVLASKYESGNAAPFLLFGGALLPLLVLARAWGAAGSPRPAARAGRALVCGASALAAAFLVLERLDPAYLEGFGL